MSYRIGSIELYVRETPPGRFPVVLGKQSREKAAPTTNPLGHVRMVLRDAAGNETFGCAGDRLSVRWLDKRSGRTKDKKLRELVELIHQAAEVHRGRREFTSPFAHWLGCHRQIMKLAAAAGQEPLTGSFASALLERALIDGVSRAGGRSVFDMLRQDRLGFQPGLVHPELRGMKPADYLPPRPRTKFFIRHTVGLADPLVEQDLQGRRVNDGLPETLEEYARTDGLRYFKVKISGEPKADLARLARIWDVVPGEETTGVTLDANEAYADLGRFEQFVRSLQRELPGLFDHVLYIEQPLPRRLTLDAETRNIIHRIADIKPLIIDEADGTLTAFKQAAALGYHGTSHKNCKGFFKSLLNKALIRRHAERGRAAVLSGEDLQNLPLVPLHQDFAALGVLDLEHCERNGHHYNFGLSFLSEADKRSATRRHGDLYVRRGDEWFLNIRAGAVNCASLQCPGFGVHDEPDWPSMTNMRAWLDGKAE